MTVLALKSLHLGGKKTYEHITIELGIKYSVNTADNRFHSDYFDHT